MRYAIVSDIHANWQAWCAVRDDIRSRGVDCVICLGDIVGYGPQPARVLDDVRANCDNFVLGNHDAVAAGILDRQVFNEKARSIIDWTIEQLDADAIGFLARMPMVVANAEIHCVHAEAAAPDRWGYICKAEDARESFEACSAGMIFVGHTHEPLICQYGEDSLSGSVPGTVVMLTRGYRHLVNVGSVGDPRDGGAGATYCIYDDTMRLLTFRRLAFDYAAFREDLRCSRLDVRPTFLDCINAPKKPRALEFTISEMAVGSMQEAARQSGGRPEGIRMSATGSGKAIGHDASSQLESVSSLSDDNA